MALPGRMDRRIKELKQLAESGRQAGLALSMALIDEGSERLNGLSRLAHGLGPRLHRLVDGQVQSTQQRLDAVNRVLADLAVPADRREQVRRLAQTDTLHLVNGSGKASAPSADQPPS